MADITWTNATRKLSDLVPWEHNPVQLSKRAADGQRYADHTNLSPELMDADSGA